MSSSGNGNILRRGINLEARRQPRMPHLAPDGSMASHSNNLTQEQSNARNFSRFRHEPHFIRIGDGRLVVELNIEGGNRNGNGSGSGSGGPVGANNNSSSSQAAGEGGVRLCSSCGKSKKAVQPQSEGDDIDLNVIPAEPDDHQENQHFCQCEHHHPIVQGTGNPPATATATATATVTAGSVGTSLLPRNAVGPMIQRGLAIGSAGMQSFQTPSLLAANNNNFGSGVLNLGQASNSQINLLRFSNPHHPQPSYILSDTSRNHQMVEQPAAAVVAAAVGPPPPTYYQNHNLVIRPMMMQQQPRPGVAGANGMIDPRAINVMPYFLPGPANPNLPGDLERLQGEPAVVDISDDENDENDELENDELDVMPLDIEEMAYEEILALQERIGNVNTGLTEEVIMERLVRRYYRVPKHRPPEHAELCSICLVEFENRDVLGRISCAHKYHFDCIKEWLLQKNICPICKRTAVVVPEEPNDDDNN